MMYTDTIPPEPSDTETSDIEASDAGPTDPTDNAEYAFAHADWDRLLPKLLRAARRRLRKVGLWETHHGHPAAMEPRELVNQTLTLIRSGDRRWKRGAAKTEETFLTHICVTMSSVAANLVVSHWLTTGVGGIMDAQASERLSPEVAAMLKEEVGLLDQSLDDDRDAQAVFRLLVRGTDDRRITADTLGWDTTKVQVVKARLMRRYPHLRTD